MCRSSGRMCRHTRSPCRHIRSLCRRTRRRRCRTRTRCCIVRCRRACPTVTGTARGEIRWSFAERVDRTRYRDRTHRNRRRMRRIVGRCARPFLLRPRKPPSDRTSLVNGQCIAKVGRLQSRRKELFVSTTETNKKKFGVDEKNPERVFWGR